MLLGSERLIASPRLKGLRVGVLANPASIDHGFGHVVDRLGQATDRTLAAIFGPQHGYRSTLQDNMIETPHTKDRRRNVPIFSLYSETREPTPEMLSLIDVLVMNLFNLALLCGLAWSGNAIEAAWTNAETIDLNVGNQILPLTLDENARARSGIGQTGRLSAGYRFTVGERSAFLVDGDVQGVNYKGMTADDYTVQLAAGPEFRPSEETSISLQGLGLQRWYGGMRAVTQVGARLALEHTLDSAQRIGVTVDARHSASAFQEAYSGWNVALYATYERVVSRSLIASASLFARSDRLNEKAYSSNEFGVSAGIGGELAHGINAGLVGTASHANYGAPLLSMSNDPRADWRLSGRVYAGLRSLRVMGFSPSISYSYTLNASSLALYDGKRSRFTFNLARYF